MYRCTQNELPTGTWGLHPRFVLARAAGGVARCQAALRTSSVESAKLSKCGALEVLLVLDLGLLCGGFHVTTLARCPAHGEFIQIDSHHCLADVLRYLRQHLRILVVRHGLHDGPRAFLWVRGLEDAATHEDPVDAELHAERCVRWCCDAPSCKIDNGQPAVALGLLQEIQRRADLLRQCENLVVIHGLEAPDLAMQGADVTDCLDHIAGACLALGADHAGSLGNAAQGLAKVAAAADKWHLEFVFVHVIALVCDGEDLALINAIHTELLQDLRLHEVADPALSHHGDGHGVDDLLDHLRVGHPCHALLVANVGGNALQCHDRTSTRFFCNLGLLRVHHVHDDTALEHRWQALLHAVGTLADCCSCHRVPADLGQTTMSQNLCCPYGPA